ncbi:MAG: 26S protease regulatory subunit [Planctomycetaceae bacterium]|nr:26S protease regulatory subunit [Planctomycetaceae bacterium]
MFKAKKPLLFARLHNHFNVDPAQLPVLEQSYAFFERANLHLAIDELSRSADSPPTLIGIVVTEDYGSVTLSKLSRPATAEKYDEGPVEYVDEPLPNKQRLSCVKRGLYLYRVDGKPLALLITEQQYSRTPGIIAEVMAPAKEAAESFAHRLTRLVRLGKAFRGHVLSLERDCHGAVGVKFHSLPAVNREQIILPAELLDRIERHTIAFSTHAKRLSAAGRHLKRGILLHGPPGTGKTYSAMYLASRMPGRTVFLLTGAGIGSIETACNMARILEPATIILEDVDLIGTQRDRQMVDANALLFELLNQMDGLADDADILFILTTNRPDVLEPALAARPGRIDQAIAVPPPDEDCRQRLFSLYSEGLTLNVSRLDHFIHKLDGVSAAFVRELLRKAAVFAAIESNGDIVVNDEHIDEALAELLVAGGPLTQSLLGAQRANESQLSPKSQNSSN